MAKNDLKDLYKKYMDIKSGQGQNMADGGKAESESSVMDDLKEAFEKAFNKPKPSPTPVPTLNQKYEKVRAENRENFDNPKMSEGGFVPEGDIKHYDEGTPEIPVQPQMNPADSDRAMQLKKIFPDWSDDKIQMMMQKTASPEKFVQPTNAKPDYMGTVPQPSPIDSGALAPNVTNQLNQLQASQPPMQHFDGSEGSVVQPNFDAEQNNPDLTPEEIQAREQELAQLKSQGAGQEAVQGDEQDILGANPAKESEIEESQNPDDKALEEQIANEDFSAGEEADENPESKESKELASEEDGTEPDEKSLPADIFNKKEALNSESKDESAGLKISPEIKKQIEELKSPENDLKNAQADRDRAIAMQQLQKGAALLGAGIAAKNGTRVDPSTALGIIGTGDKYVGLPVQKYEEQVQNQQNDPNSPVSQITKAYMKKQYNVDLPDNASYEALSKMFPMIKSDQSLQATINKYKAGLISKEGIAKENRESKEKIAKEHNILTEKQGDLNRKNRIEAQKAGQEQKQIVSEQKAEQAMSNARSKPALAMAQRNLIYIQNMKKMFEDYGDPDKWTPSQVAAWNTEKAKVAQGGTPTEGMIHELSNPTYGNQMAGLIQKFTATPTGAGQGKFIAQDRKYVDGLQDVSQGVVKGNVGDVLKSFQSGLNNDGYKNLLYRHSDALGLFNPNQEKGINAVMAAKGLSRQDAIKALINQGILKDINY